MREIRIAGIVRSLVAIGFCVMESHGAVVAPTNSQNVPVTIDHEKGSFEGQLQIAMKGSLKKANIEWNGSIKNTSSQKIHSVTFCLKAFDTDDKAFQVGDGQCILRLSGNSWGTGAFQNFKGKQRLQISPQSKEIVRVSRYEVSAIEIFDHAPNLRHIEVRCPLVWNSAIRAFADKEFHPKMMDKDSFTSNFDYSGGQIEGMIDSKRALKTFTTANTGWFGPKWERFRIDTASIYLREDEPGVCTAEIKLSFSGFGEPISRDHPSWWAVDSNFAYEKGLLDDIERLSKQADEADMDRAISQLPTEAPPPEPAEKAELNITSEPPGAEIEVNGEWIGNTPTTLKVDASRTVLRLTLGGYQTWERTFTTSPGDRRTISVSLTKEP